MTRTFASLLAISVLGLTLVAGCGDGRRRPPGGGGDAGTPTDGSTGSACFPGGPSRVCRGTTELTCNPDGSEGATRACAELGQTCANGIGCAVCRPNSGACDGFVVQRCRPDGSGYDNVATCDPAAGQACDATTAACVSPCDAAAATNSYIGCEYWPVATLNAGLERSVFSFAVVVSNPQTAPANVTVTRNGAPVASATIAAGAVQTIMLPWVEDLQSDASSSLLAGGAYRLLSTLPVTVYQFNPLEFQSGATSSYSNDASLLLPTHVLTPNYVVTSRAAMVTEIVDPGFPPIIPPSTQQLSSPGFFSVYAVEAGATTVSIQFSADVSASTDGRVRAFRRGETGTFMLGQGDVLQIVTAIPSTCDRSGGHDVQDGVDIYYCAVGPTYDLTGSEIRASARVGVIAGHNCAFVPFDKWACDHLEEHLFPEEAWGVEAIVSVTQPLRGEPNVIRILSGRDGNSITFDPASVHAPVTLNRGQILEFEAREHFRIQATEAIQVAQFVVGQDYGGLSTSGTGGQGDPAMTLAIPSEQYRTSYSFLAPSTYTSNYVNVTAPTGASITLDGVAVTGFTPIGSTGFGVARVMVSGGAHQIAGDAAFGIVVYGYASYTSYAYPGGLDLEQINIPF